METDLQAENARLRDQLQNLLDQARHNEEKMHRLQGQELRLLEMESLFELLHDLLLEYPQQFNLDNVTLFLLDPEYEIQRLVEESNSEPPAGLVLLHDASSLYQYYGKEPAIEMGEFIPEVHTDWLQQLDATPSCIAMLPLERRGHLMGTLNLASVEANRFTREHGSDFIERLASIVAISLENILNQERLKRIGLTDALTGLNNRRFFDQRLKEEIMRSLRHDQPLAALFIDADYFKAINDRHGHTVGDLALMELAKRLRRYVRLQDVLARFGGEEFAILLINDGLESAVQVAERIREEVEQMAISLPGGDKLNMTVSIGVAELHSVARELRDLDEVGLALLNRADEAVYAAKDEGRNRVIYMDDAGQLIPAEQAPFSIRPL
ncbi:MAG: sensor domain-containing diguanylate cyclase [Gammaproteobacteria bacterium]|nr:sensor domain-containing diguanylate cyclase [Gammaproteobacteria bacterium]